MSLSVKPLQAILGTMTFGGGKVTQNSQIAAMINAFVNSKVALDEPELDTAKLYQNGKTEYLLGEVLHDPSLIDPVTCKKIKMAYKANPFGNEYLTGEGIVNQSAESLAAMKTDACDLFYLHSPDPDTPLEESLAAVQKLYEKGCFKRLGVCNYTAWEVVYMHDYMKARGWVVPTVYSGLYNAISRGVESELFPALIKLNMSFKAFNPLAGGMLTGKYKDIQDAKKGTRFNEAKPFNGEEKWAKIYQDRFMKDPQFQAVEFVRAACETENMSMTEASLRWYINHSVLSKERKDGVVFGASSLEQLNENLNYFSNQEPLPKSIVDAFDAGWEVCKPTAPCYHRGCSGMGGSKYV